ncbi:hypothetical protein [Thermococcus celer]|uniref:hypothetical protein n=1 Tax=Thermococcus celer TaxID=2264 RepID=UPI0019511CAE|nr:hypothetical protein [Thermococcus celer]
MDILLGRDIPDTFYCSYNKPLGKVAGYRIIYEESNRSCVIKNWYDYADLLVYRALDELSSGSRTGAEESFLRLTGMWDGYGFRDAPAGSSGKYAVYKCALFIYLYRALQYAGSGVVDDYRHIYDECLGVIARAQDPVHGGVHTDYRVSNGHIVIEGDMNTETTSMVALALYSEYPGIIGERARKE